MSVATTLALITAAMSADYQAVLDEYRDAQNVPGISAVITHRDCVLFAGASGYADLESSRAMSADTRLYAGSMTKILTAVLALRLIEEGRLTFETSLEGIAPALADVSVRQLLTHASGLRREGDFDYWFTADFPDRPALENYLHDTELRSPPGDALHYSNIGYAALGLIIEDASQRSFRDALRALVFEPLDMQASGVPGPVTGIATGYTPNGRLLPGSERPFAGVGRRVGDRHVREYHDAGAMSPAFGAYSSARDFGKLTCFLLGFGGDDVLSRDMRARMRTKQASGWGLGLKIVTLDGRAAARHEGWFAAHRSHLLLDIENELGITVLTNGDSATPERIANALRDAVLRNRNGHD